MLKKNVYRSGKKGPFARLLGDTRGVEFVEVLVITLLVGLGCIAAWSTFGEAITGAVEGQAGEIESLGGGG